MDTVLVPIVKNTNAMINDPNNYSLIAIAAVMSKLLEHLVVTWCGADLKTSENQLALKLMLHVMCVCLPELGTRYLKSSAAPAIRQKTAALPLVAT